MLLEIRLFKKKKKEKKRKEIKIALHKRTKDVICSSNGYIYHFLDYIIIIIINY